MASSRGSFDSASFSAAGIFAVVVGRVGLLDRLPHDLLAEDRLAVDHRRHLEVGRAEVEADAAAVEVAAQGLPRFRAGGTSSAAQGTTVNGWP